MAGTVIVKIIQGCLRGRKVTTKQGITYHSFQGIPYAKPPVGDLRFKPPEPAEKWEGIRDALVEGNVAPHKDAKQGFSHVGEEDCLFLNVYTPQLPTDTDKCNLPVMVYIHGGGFCYGSGNSDVCGPDYLISENVVLVTLNYRLGALGFLSTGDSTIPGNNGLKDQVMALRWVQQNIQTFGGDNTNVTIFGESAGGGAVHLLMLSPMTRGLFQKVIAQSGSALTPWAHEEPSVARERAFRLGEALGIKTNDSKKLLEFINTFSARELVQKSLESLHEEEKHPFPLFYFPTTDGTAGDENVFLHDTPENIIREGKFHKVPFMTGVTSNEGMFVVADIHHNPSYYNKFRIPMPNDLLTSVKNEQQYNEALQKIEKFYFNSEGISKDTLQQYANLYSDYWFLHGARRTIKLQLLKSPEPIYFYHFAFEGKLRYPGNETIPDELPGVCHADDLPYLFYISLIDGQEEKLDEENLLTLRRMVKMWTNFAKTGNPTPEADSLLGVTWEPVTGKSQLKYLNIDKELTMKEGLATDRNEFWDNLYDWMRQNI